MTDVRTEVTVSGPVFDGRAALAVDEFIEDAQQAVAKAGVDEVRSELGRVLRNPTGYYESQITTDQAAQDYVVTDGGVVYGPWLAGVGSMNAITSFGGYDHWPRATADLQGKADQLAERVIGPHLARMND